jgi:hypothetical protein
MSNNPALVVFTAKSIERILREGGSASWRLSRDNARRCAYVVCTRNAGAKWGDGHEDPYAAFLVGKVSDVVPCEPTPENNESPSHRFLMVFSEYARINVRNAWPEGYQNPIHYGSLEELAIDPATLKWEKMPDSPKETTGGVLKH